MLIISILFIISIFSLYNICKIRKLYLSLQPQTRNNGAIAQLARACGSYPQCPEFESLRRHIIFSGADDRD